MKEVILLSVFCFAVCLDDSVMAILEENVRLKHRVKELEDQQSHPMGGYLDKMVNLYREYISDSQRGNFLHSVHDVVRRAEPKFREEYGNLLKKDQLGTITNNFNKMLNSETLHKKLDQQYKVYSSPEFKNYENNYEAFMKKEGQFARENGTIIEDAKDLYGMMKTYVDDKSHETKAQGGIYKPDGSMSNDVSFIPTQSKSVHSSFQNAVYS